VWFLSNLGCLAFPKACMYVSACVCACLFLFLCIL
jgi:hypothetical protein